MQEEHKTTRSASLTADSAAAAAAATAVKVVVVYVKVLVRVCPSPSGSDRFEIRPAARTYTVFSGIILEALHTLSRNYIYLHNFNRYYSPQIFIELLAVNLIYTVRTFFQYFRVN